MVNWDSSGSTGTWYLNGTTDRPQFNVLGTVEADGAPLALVSLSPSNGATDVPITTSLSATFNQSIQAGTGDIELYDGDGLVEAFTVNSSMISGSTITVTPSSLLDTETAYYVLIDDGAIEDTDGDPFDGIDGVTDWAFTTAAPIDTTPVVVSLSPANNAFDVSVETDLVIVFDQDVNLGTGNIRIYNSDTDSLVQSIDVDTATLVGDTLTIELTPLDYDTTFYVLVDSGIVENDDEEAFAGISSDTEWVFTTAEAVDTTPVIASLTPANATTGVSIDTDLVIVFDQDVNAGTGNVRIYNAATDSLVESVAVTSAMITGDTLTVELTDPLDFATTYYVLVDAGIVENDDEEAFAGITSSSEWAFTTDINGYFVNFETSTSGNKTSYASGTVTLSGLDWNLTEVLIGTSASDWKNGARSARLRGYGTSAMTMLEDKSGGADTISFSYRRFGTDPQVAWVVEYSVNGGDDWLPVGSPFTAPASDDVQVFSEPVTVIGNVRFRIRQDGTAGIADRRLNIDDILITNLDALPALEVVSLTPANNAVDVPVTTSLSITFNQPVEAGSGDIVIYNEQDQEIAAIPVTPGMISGNTLTVSPQSPLNPQTTYYVLLDAGAVQQPDQTPFPGIDSPSAWTFTTDSQSFYDGTGEAVLVNATPGSPYSGTRIFGRGLSDQSVELTLTMNVPSGVLTAATIEVPTAFGTPVAGSITLSGAASTGAGFTVDGQSIIISDTAITTDDALVVTIDDLETPATFAPGDYGSRPFAISTSGDGGTLTPIVSDPIATVTLPISILRETDVNGVPLALGIEVAVEGVATMSSFSTSNTQAAIQDGTAGIALFNSASPSPFTRGNRYMVIGPVGQFNGLSQINYAGTASIIDLGPDTEPTPIVLTIPALLADAELYEGSLVTVENLTYVSGTWGSGQTVVLEDGNSNTLNIRIQPGSTATSEPNYPVSVTGVLGQLDTTSPFTSGYRIMPRDPDDLDFEDAPPPPVGDDFAAWISTFGVAPLDGPFDAPAGDGVPNILKHVFGLAPNVAVTGSLVHVANAAPGILTFVHTRIKLDDLASDVIAEYEWSMDLVNWAADGEEMDGVTVAFDAVIIDDEDEVFDVVEVTAEVTDGSAEKLFIRIMADLDDSEE